MQMLGKLLPVLIAAIGVVAGAGTGWMLKPAPHASAADAVPASGHGADAGGETKAQGESHGDAALGSQESEASAAKHVAAGESAQPGAGNGHAAGPEDGQHEYVRLNNQFVVPVIEGTKVAALVVLSLSIEVGAGEQEKVFAREPKLRDAFLQALFDHANAGGFEGAFTRGEQMRDLRGSLLEAAVRILGAIASDVLIIDIVRQDV